MNEEPNDWKCSLVSEDDNALHKPTAPVTDISSQVAPRFKAMVALMKERRGVGMAAPQVGLSLRFFVSIIDGFKVVINPVIVSAFGGKTTKPEGCLTKPGHIAFVTRSNSVTVKWTDLKGVDHVDILHGINARIFQHEIDHLDGKCIF